MSGNCPSPDGSVRSEGIVRATYENLYGRPESDAEFLRSLQPTNRTTHHQQGGRSSSSRSHHQQGRSSSSRSHHQQGRSSSSSSRSHHQQGRSSSRKHRSRSSEPRKPEPQSPEPRRPMVVESYSCRQVFLQSYSFSREKDKKKDSFLASTKRMVGLPSKKKSVDGKRRNSDENKKNKKRNKGGALFNILYRACCLVDTLD